MRWKAIVGVLGVALTAAVVIWLATGSDTKEKNVVAGTLAEEFVPLLQDLAPSTTYHTLELRFRRHGPAAADIQRSELYVPETSLIEVWITFDANGGLSSFLSETRSLEGVVYARSRADGSDLVHEDGAGTEIRRLPYLLADWTVDSFRGALSQAFAAGIVALEGRVDLPTQMLDSRPVQVIEERRDLSPDGVAQSFGVGESVVSEGYSIPFTEDLRPVEEIRRYFMLADEKRQIRSEVVVVDADGVETIVESTDELTFEVLTP